MNDSELIDYVIKESLKRKRNVLQDINYLTMLQHYWWYEVREPDNDRKNIGKSIETQISWIYNRMKELFEEEKVVNEAERYRRRVESDIK
jgi:hypothetical protein